MQAIAIVIPVFALVAIGYLAARFGLFSDTAYRGLSEYAFSIALPAQLFRTTAAAGTAVADPIGVWGSYFLSIAITYVLALLLTRFVLRRPAADGVSIAMSAVYGNIVMIGLPLAVAGFGDAALVPVALILSVNTPALWLAGTLHMEWVERKPETSLIALLASLVRDLATNPLILSIFAGLAWRQTGWTLTGPVDRIFELLAMSGIPCALVALGASLIRFRIDGQIPTLAVLGLLKLVVMPGLAWVLAFHVFHLPFVSAATVILLCAMPAGANSFLFATRYGRVVNSASGAVALGTALSLLTAALLLGALMARQGTGP